MIFGNLASVARLFLHSFMLTQENCLRNFGRLILNKILLSSLVIAFLPSTYSPLNAIRKLEVGSPIYIDYPKGYFHLMISIRGQHATGKIQRNNYYRGSCGPSLR